MSAVSAGRPTEQSTATGAPGASAAEVCDIIVIGAGGAGMMAALFAAIKGGRVLLLESTAHVGGTTAFSGGTTWVPNTHLAAAVGAKDSIDNARQYLRNVIGARANNALLDAFLIRRSSRDQAPGRNDRRAFSRVRCAPRLPVGCRGCDDLRAGA